MVTTRGWAIVAGKAKKKTCAKKAERKVGKKVGKARGKAVDETKAALRAEIAALKAQLAAKNAGVVAMDGSIAAGAATRSLLLSNSQIKGDVYLGAPTDDQQEALAIYRRVFQVYVALDTKSVDQPEVARIEHKVEERLLELLTALRERSYRPQGYVSFHIHEPKRRLISAAPFRDRIVHHALCNVMESIIERSLVFDTYANRVNKGTHRALDRAQSFVRRFAYVLSCDVKQFFPSIDHEILRAQLRGMFPDDGVRWLADRILESGRGGTAPNTVWCTFLATTCWPPRGRADCPSGI